MQFLSPVHPNPNIKEVAHACLAGILTQALRAARLHDLHRRHASRHHLILTDSGRVQEEAPALGKPVLVMRDETERPEAVEQGCVKLIGTNGDHIIEAVQHLLDDESAYRAMALGISPYGDGQAAGRIVNALREHFV